MWGRARAEKVERMERDNRQELGRLITEQLLQKGTGANEFAREHFPGNKSRSFYNWKLGLTAPTSTGSRKQLEDALGWKPGAVTEVLNAPITQRFELPVLQDSSKQDPSVARASELTTLELITELTRRTLEMEERLRVYADDREASQVHPVAEVPGSLPR
jgi:hypothetical protein